MEIKSGRGYVYSIQYHIVWCVKYRREILTPKIEKSLMEILRKIANDNEFEIIEINTDLDHIHLLIDCKPLKPAHDRSLQKSCFLADAPPKFDTFVIF